MTANPITPNDLQDFRQNLLKDIAHILEQWQAAPARKWLKTHEVIRLLRIAPSTLQSMRDKGILPFTKIGNLIYYDAADVQKMLNSKAGPRSANHRNGNANHTGL